MIKKILVFILIVFIALIGLAWAAQDLILKNVLERVVTGLTGFNTTVGSIHYQFPATLHIQKLLIENPAEFREKTFADIPEIYVSVDLPEIISAKRIHLPEIRLNIQEVNLEKNKDGKTNAQLLASVAEAKTEKRETATASESEKKSMPFALDRFELTMRHVSYADQGSLIPGANMAGKFLSEAGASTTLGPKKMSVDLKVQKEVFTDIHDPAALVNLILLKIMYGTTFGKVLGLNPKQLLSGTLGETWTSGEEMLKQTSGLVEQSLNEVVSQINPNTLKKTASSLGTEATGTINDAAGEVKNQLGGLFKKVKSVAQS